MNTQSNKHPKNAQTIIFYNLNVSRTSWMIRKNSSSFTIQKIFIVAWRRKWVRLIMLLLGLVGIPDSNEESKHNESCQSNTSQHPYITNQLIQSNVWKPIQTKKSNKPVHVSLFPYDSAFMILNSLWENVL